MSLRLIDFEPSHVLAINIRSEQESFFDYTPTDTDKFLYGIELVNSAAVTTDNERMTCSIINDKDEIIFCAGIAQVSPEHGEAWLLVSDGFLVGAKLATRHLRKQLKKCDLVRIQAFAEFEQAARYLEVLGFEFEAILEKSGPRGANQMLYRKLK